MTLKSRIASVLLAMVVAACILGDKSARPTSELRSQRALHQSAGTLVIALAAADGIALGTDRRVTANVGVGSDHITLKFDDNPKLFSFPAPHNFVGVMTHGTAAVGTLALSQSIPPEVLFYEVRAHSPNAAPLISLYRSQLLTWDKFMPDFVATLPPNRLTVAEYADRLKAFLDDAWQKYPTPAGTSRPGFIVAGYNDGEAIRYLYHFNPGTTQPSVRIRTGSAIGGISSSIAKRLIDAGEGPGYTDTDIRQQFLKLPAADVQKIIDRLQREAAGRPNYRPPSQSVQATAELIRYVIATTVDIQNSLSVDNAFLLGGQPDIATITPANGFQRKGS